MLNILERILGVESQVFEGPVTVAPKPQQLYGDDKAVDVIELDTDVFIAELCRLIARQSKGDGVRNSYEAMLQRLHRINGTHERPVRELTLQAI